MTDWKLTFNADRSIEYSDLHWDGTTFETHDGLENLILTSLFIDARADEDEVPSPNDRRGFIGDEILGITLGSKLWLLDRAKNMQEARVLAEQYVDNALQWMIDDGIFKSVETTALKQGTNRIRISSKLEAPDGDIEEFTFSVQWKAQLGLT